MQIVKGLILGQAKTQGSVEVTNKILTLLAQRLADADAKTVAFVLNKVFEEGVFAKVNEESEEK